MIIGLIHEFKIYIKLPAHMTVTEWIELLLPVTMTDTSIYYHEVIYLRYCLQLIFENVCVQIDKECHLL